MISSSYLIGQLIIVLLTFGLISALLYGLTRALAQLGAGIMRQRTFVGFVMAGLLIWLAITALLAFSGYFRDYSNFPPKIYWALAPPTAVAIVLAFSRSVGKLLRVIPMGWLIYIQSFRLITELFFWMGYRGGYVPQQLTFEWLNYDIIVGLTAPMAGYVFFAVRRFQRFEAILWNVFGIALLANVVFLGTLSTPSPYRVFMNDPPNTFIAEFPFVWIPAFIMPFALAMHLFSLRQVLQHPVSRRRFQLRRNRFKDQKGS